MPYWLIRLVPDKLLMRILNRKRQKALKAHKARLEQFLPQRTDDFLLFMSEHKIHDVPKFSLPEQSENVQYCLFHDKLNLLKSSVCEPVNPPPLSFSDSVMKQMEDKGIDAPEFCRRVGMDRRLLSKIRTEQDYQPSKETALSCCVALRLTVEEAEKLLKSAGYSLSDYLRRDVIVRYFLTVQHYDIDDINGVIHEYEDKCI